MRQPSLPSTRSPIRLVRAGALVIMLVALVTPAMAEPSSSQAGTSLGADAEDIDDSEVTAGGRREGPERRAPPTGRRVRHVIPSGSEQQLAELLGPILSDARLPVRGVSIQETIIIISIDAAGEDASIVLHHARQRPRETPEHTASLRKARLFAVLECAGCDEDTIGLLRDSLSSINVAAWRAIWLSPEEAPRKRPSLATVSKQETSIGTRKLPTYASLLSAFFAMALVIIASTRSKGSVLPIEHSSGETRGPMEALGGELRPYDIVALGAILLFVAWPVYLSPIVDAGLVRLHDAVHRPFGCPGHPAPPFLLIWASAKISLAPWAARLPLLLILLANVLLISFVSAKAAGRWAGILAGLWLTFEVRRRHGMHDIAFWDLASLFVIGLLLWLMVVEKKKEDPGLRMWLLLGAMLVGGLYSSWLFIVPAGLMVFCLGILAVRKTVGWTGTAAIAGLVALLALRVLVAFLNVGETPIGSPGNVVADLLLHTPIARSVWMLVPLAAGAAWLLFRQRPPWELAASSVFALFSAPAIIAALFVMGGVRYVTGGYYLQIVSGPMVHLAGIGAGALIASVAGFIRVPAARRITGPILAVAIGVLTFSIPHGLPMMDVDGVEYMGAFDEKTRHDPAPIFANDHSIDLLMGYERAGRGEAWDLGELSEIIGRVVPLDPVDCSLDERQLEHRFDLDHLRRLAAGTKTASPRHYVVIARNEFDDMSDCLEILSSDCTRLALESRIYNYFECDRDAFGILADLVGDVPETSFSPRTSSR